MSSIERLKYELERHWNWLSVQPHIRKADIKSIKADYNDSYTYNNEEAQYPFWDELNKAYFKAVDQLKDISLSNEDDLFDVVLEAITTDYEAGYYFDMALERIHKVHLNHFYEAGLFYPLYTTRFQFIERLNEYDIPDKGKKLNFIINNDEHLYCKRVALNLLAELNLTEAQKAALNFIEHEDEYLRLSSLIILKKSNYAFLHEVKNRLSNDKSQFIQKELRNI